MAPQQATTKPKRKRQRRRRQMSSDESSSDDSSSSEEETPIPAKLPTPSASSSASGESEEEEESSSEESSSSEEEESSDDGGRRGRRGRGAKAATQQQQAANGGASTSTSNAMAEGSTARRPYPSRSPSPASYNPANLPLGQSIFPLLKPLPDGQLFDGLIPGDNGYVESGKEEIVDEETVKKEREREKRFGDWWRARLVNEFEGELGDLAAEPGLTPPRLALLLTSLTSLSSLHSTTSSLARSSNSIWLHDPSTSMDPLAALNIEEGAEEWSKAKVGGEGDVEVGEEGVPSAETGRDEGMEVDA